VGVFNYKDIYCEMKQLIRHILREHTREIVEAKGDYNRSNTDDFIAKARKVNGDKYDYSKTNYLGAREKLNVICPIHGEFPVSASNHLKGRGCPQCAKIARANFHRSDTNTFIQKAKKIHGDVYDYSLVNYENNSTPVEIICPEHGSFFKSPQNHLKGQGCPKCTEETNYRGSSQKYGDEEFIKKSQELHGDKYDYSKVEYKNSRVPVLIGCPEHGFFPQQPSSHLSGVGCPKCAGKDKTKEEFIKQAKEVQGDKYDYSEVDYKGARTKVKIICPKHGEFLQTPNQHLGGNGCPSCNESKGEKLINNLLIKHNIEQIRQKRFVDCTNKPAKGIQCVTLPFDFYLPALNTIIEYDGQQHYVPVWGEDNFKRLQRLDKIRNQYCKKNGIKLIRIPYTMKKEDIEPYILKELGIK
jgi:very-short-patch-repair endonuclease